jgi:hypothetical protein
MRFVLRLHGRKVADLQARITGLQRLVRRSSDNSRDTAFYDIGHALLEWRDAGRTDGEIIEGLEDLVVLRMAAGLEDAVDVLTEGES